jgi:hypothetical protein
MIQESNTLYKKCLSFHLPCATGIILSFYVTTSGFAVTMSKKKIDREYNATLSISEKKYLKFIHSPPRSSFKKLFIGTNLGEDL